MAKPEQLRAALENDDRQQLLRLCGKLDRNLTVTAGGYERSMAHHIARKWYGRDCLKLLIDKVGTECLTCIDKCNQTPVHLAAQNQDEASMSLIHEFLGQGCFEKKGRYQRTAVHCAALNNRSNSALKWLVRLLGPDCLRVQDEFGNTPVHLSAWKQGSDSMELFKAELGASCFHQLGRYKRTAIHMAAMNEGSNEALRWLINECGSDSLTVKDAEENTPVHLAAWKQGEDSMKIIKDQLGSLVFIAKANKEKTATHKAAQNTISSSALAWCVRDLGPRCLQEKDSINRMSIHLAAQYQNDSSIKMAVNSLGKSCLTLPDDKQRTVVHYAAMNDKSNAALRWIVSQLGPECLKQPDAAGSMPIHLAAQHQDVDSLRFIRDSLGASAFKLEGCYRQTIAHYATRSSKRKEMIEWIVSEIGPQCMLVADAKNHTPEQLAGYYE